MSGSFRKTRRKPFCSPISWSLLPGSVTATNWLPLRPAFSKK
jgi:hypothetical protein